MSIPNMPFGHHRINCNCFFHNESSEYNKKLQRENAERILKDISELAKRKNLKGLQQKIYWI